MLRTARPRAPTQALDEQDRAFLDRVRAAVHEVEPDARVILYGSHARGDAESDSDWDLLVLVDGFVPPDREAAIDRRLLEFGRETDAILSVMVYSHEEWDSPLFRAMPYRQNVMREGRAEPNWELQQPESTVCDEQGAQAMSDARAELIRHRLRRAREALAEADMMAQAGHWNTCVNRLYYSCFYAASALLLQHSLSSARHSGVLSLFNQHFVQARIVSSDLWSAYNQLFVNRAQADYGDLVVFGEVEVRPWILQARQFVERIEELLLPPPPSREGG